MSHSQRRGTAWVRGPAHAALRRSHVDICSRCMGTEGEAAEAGDVPRTDRPRRERGRGLRFRRVGEGEGRTVRCDGRCRGWLPEQAWFFWCAAGCDFDVCVACVAELRRRGGRVQASGGRKRALPGPDGAAVGQGGEWPAERRRARLRRFSARVPRGSWRARAHAPASVPRVTHGPRRVLPPL